MLRISVFLVSLSVLVAATPVDGAEDVELIVRKARELQAAGEFDRAMDYLTDALEAHQDQPEILLELARSTHNKALGLLAENASLGRLALLDAINWYRKSAEARPDHADAWRGLGHAYVSLNDWMNGAANYRRATELDPADAESRYQIGYCLGLLGAFEEAIAAFNAAETLLGPDPRLLLNRSICQASLGRTAVAEKGFLRLLETEIEAKRAGSPQARSGFTWMWKLHKEAGTFDKAEAVFAKLSETYPETSSAHWYLGHARLRLGNPAGAVEPFSLVVTISPTWAEGWLTLGETQVSAGQLDGAFASYEKIFALDPGGGGPRDLLFLVVKGRWDAGEREKALALLAKVEEQYPDDAWVVEVRADYLLRAGRPADAIVDYRAAVELNPFNDDAAIKEQKALTILLRDGEVPSLRAGGARGTPAPEFEPAEGGSIVDFETSEVFPRAAGATGTRAAGAFHLVRNGAAGTLACLSLTLIPTIDASDCVSVSFNVKGEKGKGLTVRAKDAYDQFEITNGFIRLLHRDPIRLTGDWQTVVLPLEAFGVSFASRPIPMNRARIRALVFDIGTPLVEGLDLADEIWIDDVVLIGKDGNLREIESFDDAPNETLFLSDGAATPFARTLARPEQLAEFRPDANTYVLPAIFGEEYDPRNVHSGVGSYRLTLTRPGTASGVMTFNPDRSYDRANAITFWARGAAGGEKLRVTFFDAMDQHLGTALPASAPRLTAKSSLTEGWFVLTPEWKRYVIRRSDFPDIDFRSLLEVRFHMGTPEGNPEGTTLYLDDIAWE